MSDPVPFRRRTTTGNRPGRIVLTIGEMEDEFVVSNWGMSADNQTLSLFFADGHEEHILLGAGDRYAFWPA